MEKIRYDNGIVRQFGYATVLWGLVGMLVGLIAASQLAFSSFFAEYLAVPELTFGRVRPLHTNAIIFAFVGNAIFMGVYYSLQRLLKARMLSDALSQIHFWGWQLIIISAALTLLGGYTTGKEYAELEWPIDIAITLIWVIFGINMIGTIIKRREQHIYVAIWFYLGTFITVAILHVVNSFEMPVSFLKSYSWYAGVQDALVQWWYGHNAVAFFLTTPYLGLMYYFLPKAANRPVYSYKLSIVHFWTLVLIYIWAGPHHLLYSALPDWAQNLGVAFSVMLIAPSWGGMVNGLLTLRGAWDKVRTEPVLKFMVVALTGYGMATFEGPMLSLKNVNALGHFTDWIVGHVHIGGLAWNGFLTFGILYWLVPKMWNTKLHSLKMANTHFWIGTLGILFYSIPLYWAGFTQGLMWKEFNEIGELKYPVFLDTVLSILPMYVMRAIGGLLYLVGAIIMTINLAKTVAKGSFVKDEEVEVTSNMNHVASGKEYWHRAIERKPILMLVLAGLLIIVGTVVELVPTFLVKSNIPTIASVKPYTPLELQGRDIYIREGCYTCHSQMVRPFRNETERYGEYSKAGEFVYDHPFQWGSKRTGPDLAREGNIKSKQYKSNDWHFNHMLDPTSMSDGSIMPPYPWLIEDELDNSTLESKISAMQTLGVPYEEGYEKVAIEDLKVQAEEITKSLEKAGIEVSSDREIIALIAYLQKLGRDINESENE